MKVFNNIVKILTALAAVAGLVYIFATYGEQIAVWCKKTLASLPKCPCCKEAAVEEVVEDFEEEEAEEAAEEIVEEAAPEIVVSDTDPVAAEEDFAE